MAVLRDYIKVKHGFAFKGDHITTIDNGIVLVTPGNFSIGGGFKEEKCKFFDGEYPTDYVLKPGDLIVTMTDLSKAIDALGYSALVPKSKRIYLHNQRIGLVKIIDEERLDKNYLYWFMRTAYYQKTIAATSSGSTVHHTSPDRIMDVEIELPDLEKQRAVATFMGNIESKINTNKQINKNLEQQIEMILIKTINDADTQPVKLGDYLYIKGRIGWKGLKKSEYLPISDYRIINGESLTLSGIDWNKAGYISAERYEESPEIMLNIGDILLSKDGTIGKIGYVDKLDAPTSVASGIFVIRNTRQAEISTQFIYYLLKSKLFKAFIASRTEGSVIPHLYQKDFMEFEFQLPSPDDMKIFDNTTAAMFSLVFSNLNENERLIHLRDSLLPKLMSGELDISALDL